MTSIPWIWVCVIALGAWCLWLEKRKAPRRVRSKRVPCHAVAGAIGLWECDDCNQQTGALGHTEKKCPGPGRKPCMKKAKEDLEKP